VRITRGRLIMFSAATIGIYAFHQTVKTHLTKFLRRTGRQPIRYGYVSFNLMYRF